MFCINKHNEHVSRDAQYISLKIKFLEEAKQALEHKLKELQDLLKRITN